MKKYIVIFAMSVVAASAFADKIVKNVSLNSSTGETLTKLVGDEKFTIDSLVVSGWPGTDDYATMRTMCQEGRLRGIDLSGVYNESIPADAFYAGIPADGIGIVKEVNLNYITLPKKIQEIRSRAFSGTHIRILDISATMMNIADDAFSSCNELKEVIIHSPYVPVKFISSQVFCSVPSDAVLFVPQGYKVNYEGDSRWKCFRSIDEKDDLFRVKSVDLSHGSLETELGDDMYTVDSLYITGEYHKSDNEALVKAVMDGKVRGIDMSCATAENNQFGDLYYSKPGYETAASVPGLRYFRFPKGLKMIREAWTNANFLDFDLPKGLTEIGRSAFVGCNMACDIHIPEGVEKISQFAFSDVEAGENLYLPSTLKTVEFASIELSVKKGEKFNIFIDSFVPPVYDRAGCAPVWTETPFTRSYEDNIPDNFMLYVPVGAAESYRVDKCWSHFKNIVETPDLTGGTSGIAATIASATKTSDNRIYSLDGRYVGTDMSRLGKGVYVVNGKKVVR